MIKKGVKVKVLSGKDKNKDGDVIEIEISHLGVLKNIVHKEN